jgi:hypothetical protein
MNKIQEQIEKWQAAVEAVKDSLSYMTLFAEGYILGLKHALKFLECEPDEPSA